MSLSTELPPSIVGGFTRMLFPILHSDPQVFPSRVILWVQCVDTRSETRTRTASTGAGAGAGTTAHTREFTLQFPKLLLRVPHLPL